jgi:hypothetical protein
MSDAPREGAPEPRIFSRESQIRIDREGRFWHEGERIDHSGLARAFAQWVVWDEASQRYQLRNSMDWCWITVDDAPLVVVSAHLDDDGEVLLSLSDGTVERLALETLRIDREDVPYCTVRGGTVDARFLQAAAFSLLEHAEPDGDQWALVLGPKRVALVRVVEGVSRVGRAKEGVS